MSNPFIIRVPREGEDFYILHHKTGEVILPIAGGLSLSTPFDHYDGKLWNIKPGTANLGTYAFVNKLSKEVLYSNSLWLTLSSGRTRVFSGDYFHMRSVDQGDNVFHMWKDSLFPVKDAGVHAEREVKESSHPGTTDVVDDSLFSFLPNDFGNKLRWDRIELDIDNGRILSSTPEAAAPQVIVNNTDVNQSQYVEFTLKVEKSSSFEHTHGFSIMAGTGGKVGIPFVAEGSIKLETTTTHNWTWGNTETRTSEVTANFPVVAPPRSTVTATAMMTRSVLDIPFRIYTTSPSSGIEIVTHGIYKGVDVWGLRSELNQHSQISDVADKKTIVDVKYTERLVSVHREPTKKPT